MIFFYGSRLIYFLFFVLGVKSTIKKESEYVLFMYLAKVKVSLNIYIFNELHLTRHETNLLSRRAVF